MDKEIVYRVEDGMDREKILCTTYQMRNFYMQFRDGFFTNLDVMNYIQHLAAAHMAKKGMNVLDVCCGRSLMLPLLRYYAKDIASYTGVDISKANIKEAMRGATAKNLEPKDLASYYPFRVGWKLGNVAEMSKVIPAGFADFVIYIRHRAYAPYGRRKKPCRMLQGDEAGCKDVSLLSEHPRQWVSDPVPRSCL